jgi:hypothetical protein
MEKDLKVDFIGIGSTKSGTTWLFYMLGQHPQICRSEPKEIGYFNYAHYVKDFARPHELKLINRNHTKPFSWYKRHFRHCSGHTIKGEFTPYYLYDERAPSLIKQYFPEVKLIVCLRNPIDRAYSLYWEWRSYRKRENRTFEESIKEDRRYIEHGFYYKYLSHYIRCFELDQIMVVLFDNMIINPEQEIINVFRFLKIDTDVKLDLGKIPRNKAKRSRFVSAEPILRHFSNLLRDLDQFRLLRFIRSIGIKELIIKLSTTSFKYPEMNPETRQFLRSVFKDDISKLEKLFKLDLSHWG